jgi:hypothetical protein
MRIQEFYESNLNTIRDNYFTLETLIHEYALKNDGKFDYFTKWSGFNFPKKVLRQWMIKFQGNISEKELAFINFLADNIPPGTEDYYIIATWRDDDIKHEIAHALYYLDSDYKEQMENLNEDLDEYFYEAIYEQLYNDNYCEEVIQDEIQAYIATSDKVELKIYLGIKFEQEIIDKYVEVFNKKIESYETSKD